MSLFANDCGEGIPEEKRRLLDAVGPCERCRATYLHVIIRAAGQLLERQPEAVRDAVRARVQVDSRRVVEIEAEAHRIARELLGGGR